MHRFEKWIVLFLSVIAGALAGGLVEEMFVIPRLDRIESRLNIQTRIVAPTSTAVEIIPVIPKPFVPSLPDPLVTRRLSSVATIVRRLPGKQPEDFFAIPQDREIGAAVALTSDGWFASTFSLLGGQRPADLWLMWNGRAYAIQQAIRDTATDAVFVKVDAKDAPVSALVHAQDVVVGVPVWLEPRAGRLYPGWIADTKWRSSPDPVSSERVARRMIVNASFANAAWMGGVAWDGAGQLVGLMEGSSPEGWRLLPAGDLSRALESLLASGKITHALLGVRASDRAHLFVANGSVSDLARGAWLRGDRKLGSPAVMPQGPAGKLLQDGDVIERVERDILDGTADLGELLLEYRPSANVTLSGSRSGKAMQWNVTLGSVVTSEIIK